MALRSATTIAAIILKDAPLLALGDLADEIQHSAFAQRAGVRAITWDCDDLVFLDFDSVRIALHEVPNADHGGKIICVAVGAVVGHQLPKHIDSARLVQNLVKRFCRSVDASAILWHEDSRPLSPIVIDDFHDELSNMLGYLDLQLQECSAPQEPPAGSALNDETALNTLRAELRAKGATGGGISRPIHLSLYCLAGTFFFLAPAVGSTLLSYIWLRDGVDKKAKPS